MAIIVEDGSIVANANSYVSVLEVDSYLVVRPGFTTWDALLDTQKENYLIWATQLLDQRATFYGQKADETSSLRWPRKNVVDRDGVCIPYDTIPKAIKEAVMEIAFYLQQQGIDPSTPLSPGGEIQRVKLAVIEIEYEEGTGSNTQNYFPIGINDLLLGLGSISRGGTGSAFMRIRRA